MKSKNLARILFASLIAVEITGWLGALPWTPTYSWLGLIITAVAVWAFVEWFHIFERLWPWIFAGLLLDAVADTFNLYYSIGSWDRLMHLIGGALIALAVLYALRPVLSSQMPMRWRIILILALVALFGTFYEAMEMSVDVFYTLTEGAGRGALGDGVDTVEDQLLNIIGGLAAVGIVEYRRSRPA